VTERQQRSDSDVPLGMPHCAELDRGRVSTAMYILFRAATRVTDS